MRLFWTGYGIKVIGCFIFADTLYSFTKLLVKYPPMGLITKVSKMLPYSTTAQKLRTYWASGVLLSLLWTSSKLYSTTTTLNIIREKLKWLQHHILIMRNGLLDLLFAFSTKQSSVLWIPSRSLVNIYANLNNLSNQWSNWSNVRIVSSYGRLWLQFAPEVLVSKGDIL